MAVAFFQTSLVSNLELPELPSASAPPEIRFRFETVFPRPRQTAGARHDWRQRDGQISLSLFKSERSYRLVFPDTTNFAISSDGGEIVGCPISGRHAGHVRHHLLSQVLPRVLSHRGRVVLHASAVAGPQGAIALLGRSGDGKSTIAASCLERGYEVLADDCLVLTQRQGNLLALPSSSGVRLHRSAATHLFSPGRLARVPDAAGKVRVVAETPGLEPTRLVGAVLLQPGGTPPGTDGIHREDLPPAAALMALVEHSFQLELWDREPLSARLRALTAVARSVPVIRVRFRQQRREIGALRDCVLHLLRTVGRGP